MRRWIPLAALLVVALGASALALTRRDSAAPPPLLRIVSVRGSTFARHGLTWVRVTARVCDGARTPTTVTEVDLDHYGVSQNGDTWWLAYATEQRAPWLVSLQETWKGKTCGPVHVEGPIPQEDVTPEALAAPHACYGVNLRIVAGKRSASKRAVLECPFGRGARRG